MNEINSRKEKIYLLFAELMSEMSLIELPLHSMNEIHGLRVIGYGFDAQLNSHFISLNSSFTIH